MKAPHNETDEAKRPTGLSHGFWMVVCCLAPVALIAVLAYSGVSLKGFGILAVLLLCPLIHFVMMRRGHHGSVVRAMAVKRLQWGPLARVVLGVEWNDPRNSDFKMSFGQSIRYFLRFDYDLGLLDILTGRHKTNPRHPRLRKRYEEHPVGG